MKKQFEGVEKSKGIKERFEGNTNPPQTEHGKEKWIKEQMKKYSVGSGLQIHMMLSDIYDANSNKYSEGWEACKEYVLRTNQKQTQVLNNPYHILTKKISGYNETVNDMSKFKLSEKEMELFVSAMKEYKSVPLVLQTAQEEPW